MNKEKQLKIFILMFTLQIVCVCSYWFLSLSRKILNINILYLFPLLVLFLISTHYVNKRTMSVMPMILSIHDTVEKYEKQNAVLYPIVFVLVMAGIKLQFKYSGILSNIIASLAWRPLFFININSRRIEYLKNKPDGMNF